MRFRPLRSTVGSAMGSRAQPTPVGALMRFLLPALGVVLVFASGCVEHIVDLGPGYYESEPRSQVSFWCETDRCESGSTHTVYPEGKDLLVWNVGVAPLTIESWSLDGLITEPPRLMTTLDIDEFFEFKVILTSDLEPAELTIVSDASNGPTFVLYFVPEGG